MPSLIHSAILHTLIYADLFDYPLTEDEVWKWLIGKCSNATMLQCYNALKDHKNIQEKDGYYFLKGRTKIVQIRQQREKWSVKKLKIAQRVTNFLKYIPSIKLIGVSGALALDNVKKDDDIDLFIVSENKLVWTTRFFATFLMELMGVRRHPNEKETNDKICLNMFVDEDHLQIAKDEKDLFSAHEVAQLKPLYDRDEIYGKFLKANDWVKEYLPNAISKDTRLIRYNDSKKRNLRLFNILEKLLYVIQLWYMRGHRTKEVIKDGIIRFHPKDARERILRRFKLAS
jgi:predicted nucleotidyltransferase